MRTVRHGAAVLMAALLTGAALATAGYAGAAPSTPGAANQGSADGDFGAGAVHTGALARCMMTGTSNAHLDGFTVPGTVRFGAGDSSCTLHGHTAITRAASAFGAVDAVRDAAGLGLELHDYSVTCTATATSADATVTIGAVRAGSRVGLPAPGALPDPVPVNHRVPVSPEGASPGGTVTFNEQLPNGTGGVTVSVAHYRQRGGGDILLGRADCSPFG